MYDIRKRSSVAAERSRTRISPQCAHKSLRVTAFRNRPMQETLTDVSLSHATLVRMSDLMAVTRGSPEIAVGLIDGPVNAGHPDLVGGNIRQAVRSVNAACSMFDSIACEHGTLVAGVLSAKRTSPTPAICPSCTLLVRPIFLESSLGEEELPSATPGELAEAIVDTVEAGAHVINLSVGLADPSSHGGRRLDEALTHALNRGVIVVAAAGNQSGLGCSMITRRPWVVPVAAFDLSARPMSYSNLGTSIGRRGLGAPGDGIVSTGADGALRTFGGTSAAAPFVTGTIALLWSAFPQATPANIRFAVAQAGRHRSTVVPPLLNANAAYRQLESVYGGNRYAAS